MNREIPLNIFKINKTQIQTLDDLKALEQETGELFNTEDERKKLDELIYEERLRIGWEII